MENEETTPETNERTTLADILDEVLTKYQVGYFADDTPIADAPLRRQLRWAIKQLQIKAQELR